jgi:predicted nucleotidyltransferase
LVELGEGTGLFEFIKIKHELEDILKMPVDLVEYSALKPLLQNGILQQERRIYG